MTRNYLFLIFTLVFFLNSFGQNKQYKPVKYPSNYEAKINLFYTKVDNWVGRMDIYSNPSSIKPTPIVINIHGGGWNHGTKESQTGFNSFFKEGYAVANVAYRLVNISPAPGAIEDIRSALIYLCNHAEELNIDTKKIVIMGGSSGAHLALMAGLLNNDRKFDRNNTYEGNIEIAAIIDKYGPTDLNLLKRNGSVKRWLGEGYENRKFIKSVSPLYYIDKNSPPVFIVHGDKDPIIPYGQSVFLYEKLNENNIKSEFITIKGGVHGKFTKEQRLMLQEKMWLFLEEIGLKNIIE